MDSAAHGTGFVIFIIFFNSGNGQHWPWVLPHIPTNPWHWILYLTVLCVCVCPCLSPYHPQCDLPYLSVKAMRSHVTQVIVNVSGWIQAGHRHTTWSTSFASISHFLSDFHFPSCVNYLTYLSCKKNNLSLFFHVGNLYYVFLYRNTVCKFL